MSMYILGINSVYHESSACLIKNGKLIAAIEEERFNRIKHGKPARIDNADELPINAINHCLKEAGIELKEVDYIGLSFDPEGRLENIGADKFFIKDGWSTKEGEELFYKKIKTIPNKLTKMARESVSGKTQWISHHVCHAASTFLVSPFKESAILVVDGIGEFGTTWFGRGNKNKIEMVGKVNYPNSLGFVWEKMSGFFGFSEYDSSKLMGLSAYGNPNKFYSKFKKIVRLLPNGQFKVNNNVFRFRTDDFRLLEKHFGIKKLRYPDERTSAHEDLAASLQKITDKLFLHFAKHLKKQTHSNNLCLAGGVALNCVANAAIMKSGLFKNIYIQPAASDMGTALGAAYYIWNQVLNKKRSFVMNNAYWGPRYSDKEVEKILRNRKIKYEKVKNIEKATAKLLTEENIIGWFQGRVEFGPRALGNRSLLVDPRNKEMKDILNYRIKKREPFRPFAPSVLEEDYQDWFKKYKTKSISNNFMIINYDVQKTKVNQTPAVVHVDNTSRVQVVNKGTNPKYHRLISEFKKLTGVPIILNTSFNENEPIVCSPEEAVNTFLRTRMDYLVINNFLISRHE